MPRSAKSIVDIKSLARAETETCIRTLAGVVRSRGAPPAARVLAANSLLDRGWGKPAQQLVGADGGDIKIVIRQIIETAAQSANDDTLLIEHDDAEGQD